jgi:EAL domain-containing protein (putative c-di-GMP-specific phosphodiesterase class I)
MDSVAEYVETTDIAKELRQLGVDYGRVMGSVGQSRPARFCDPSIEDE